MVVATVLFNGGVLCPRRVLRCLEFLSRHSEVVLITNVWGLRTSNKVYYYACDKKGFIDYVLINKFLNQVRPYAFTYIDNDLILPDNYFKNLKIDNDTPRIMHGFSVCYEHSDKRRVAPSIIMNCVEIGKFFGHSGYSWTFNKKMLELIDYKFPEVFLLGGFDYFLANCVKNKYIELIDRSQENDFYLLEWYHLKFHCAKWSYYPVAIEHIYHGPHLQRLTPFNDYNGAEEFIKKIN